MPKLKILAPGQMRDGLTVKNLLAIAKHCEALEMLQMHTNRDSLQVIRSRYQEPFRGDSSDYDGCPLRAAIFGVCSMGGTLLSVYWILSSVDNILADYSLLSPCMCIPVTLGSWCRSLLACKLPFPRCSQPIKYDTCKFYFYSCRPRFVL